MNGEATPRPDDPTHQQRVRAIRAILGAKLQPDTAQPILETPQQAAKKILEHLFELSKAAVRGAENPSMQATTSIKKYSTVLHSLERRADLLRPYRELAERFWERLAAAPKAGVKARKPANRCQQ